MLNYRILIIILAVNSALAFKKDTRFGKKISCPKPKGCETVRCPAVEHPACARLVNRGANNKTVYVLMVNKCEINYAKCYEGSKRSKRQVESDETTEDVLPPVIPEIDHMVLPVPVHEKFQNNKEHEEDIGNERAETAISEENSPDNSADESATDGPENPDSEHLPDDTSPDTADHNTEENNSWQQPISALSHELEHEKHGSDHPIDDNGNNPNIIDDYGNNDSNNDDYDYDPDKSFDNDFYAEDYSNVDESEYEADCPSVCPARDVMVCARCQHGVFRTFLTVCHMRMFTCAHTDEKLQLISRTPCVMSAPYLSEGAVPPRGRVREPQDADRVLRYLRCRDVYTQQSRETNYKCLFDDSETNMAEPSQVDDK